MIRLRILLFVAVVALLVSIGVNRICSTRPEGEVSAICNDGTVSRSTSRSGTCAHHGGVKQWTK